MKKQLTFMSVAILSAGLFFTSCKKESTQQQILKTMKQNWQYSQTTRQGFQVNQMRQMMMPT